MDPDERTLKAFESLTIIDDRGDLNINAGRHTRTAIMAAFEMIGGTERLAEWADENPGEFFTKLFPKMATREVDDQIANSIEDMLDQLDGGALPGKGVLDGEYVEVDTKSIPSLVEEDVPEEDEDADWDEDYDYEDEYDDEDWDEA